MSPYSTAASEIARYLTDESAAFVGTADRLYTPTDANEVAAILRQATEEKAAITISGAGTSITGARVPTGGGWILATDQLRRIGETQEDPGDDEWQELTTGTARILVNRDLRRARVPAGLRLAELDAMLQSTGLHYPPDPTETTAMIGGTVATNASGARSYHFGPTRSWVEAVTVVTPGGTVIHLGRGEHQASGGSLDLGQGVPTIALPSIKLPRDVKNAAGYYIRPEMDAVDLFVGGEGTLGVITEVEVRLAPRQFGTVTLTVFVGERDAALDLADAARSGSFAPGVVLSVEFFDAGALEMIRGRYGDTPEAAAAVVLEILPDGQPAEAGKTRLFGIDSGTGSLWRSLLEAYEPVESWVILPGERERMRLFRHSLPARVNEFVRSRHGKLGTDMAVPGVNFREMMEGYDQASRSGIRTVLFGHLGDFHLHLNFLVESEEEMRRARELYAGLAQKAIEFGGTISAEHGVGKKRITVPGAGDIPYLELMVGRAGIRAMQAVKTQLDPTGILNRDTMIPWVSVS